jgi:hypothetical protein
VEKLRSENARDKEKYYNLEASNKFLKDQIASKTLELEQTKKRVNLDKILLENLNTERDSKLSKLQEMKNRLAMIAARKEHYYPKLE